MAIPAPEIWLLRHAASEWARSGRHTGPTDLPLQRARRTCERAGLGERAVLCDDLREWDSGT